jgi:amino acid adenylation domain-containing protein
MPHRHFKSTKMLKQQTATHNMSILNECPVLLQGPDLLHDLVAPSSTAVAIDFLEDGSKRRRFSYKTLHTLSDSLAQKICKSLEKLENASVIIPVLLPQCPELYIVLLAILKAGKAFCPLSLDAPKERLDFILKDVSADLLITDSARGRLLNIKSDIITLYVDQDSFREDQHSSLTLASVHTSDLAYVLYTSGSTGRPKAVSVSHRAVTQSLLAHDRHIPHFTRFLQFAAPTFDVSIFEIFFPWYRGCTLASRTRTRMLDNLPESIRALDVDAAELTPTVVSNLLQGRSSVPSLKLLLTIGEMLTQDVIKEYGSSPARDGILWAMYGPTEAAIHCTLQPHLSATASTQMIGFPLDTVSAFIVASSPDGEQSSAFSILPIGEEGELVIGGHQIAEEYLNRPELTVASFMHHPQYGPLYRTGDRARLRDNGTLECLGRVTVGQVKFRGQRIELGEIEQIVLKVEGCRAATVKVIDEVLVAFCATGSRKVSHADVLQTCKRWLPSIMIPTDVIFISRMPQSSSGKVDQGSLIAMYRQTSQENYSEKSDITTSAGHTVLELLRYHLKRDLAPESNLRSVGLDSLRVIRLASAIRAEGYQVTAVDILRATVVEDILRIAKATGEKDALQVPEEKNFTEDMLESYPELHPWHEMIACTLSCTPLQEAMLAETVARPSAYCNWIEVELTELHSFDDIKVTLRELANANEILRSGFCPAVSQRGNFVQVVWRELDDSQIQDVRDFTRHFSLSSRESLLRPLLIQLGSCDGKPRLLFQIHHALYDGWSLDLILQDLENLLHGNTVKQRPQYREVVKYHSKLTELSTNLDKDYWTELLRDRTEASLPNFNGRIVEHAATEYFVGRSTVDVKDLLERSHELNVSPQVYFQAASAFVSSLYVGSSDIVIGNVSSGRTIPVTGVDSIIGPCIASLPFRLRFGSLATVQDILYETQRQNREGLEHCSLPLREIAKVANVHEGTRLFDVLFVWQQSIDSIADSSTAIRIVESADELEFRITLEFEPHPDHISFRATFRSSAISDHQVDYLFRQIDEVVHCFLKDIGTRTTEIVACFSTAVCSIANSVPRQRKILYGPAHAVERWAAVTPHKAALSFFHSNDGAMRPKSTATYASLNSRTNQLARALSGQGVRQGCLVGIVMEKSMDLYAAILAVLKLGAGYLPLVPDLPEERVKIILRESQVAVCIADSSTSFRLQQLTSSTVVDISQVDIAAYADNNIETSYRGTDIAYAVFTSGSTGSPKGVLITQDNLMSNLEYLSTIYPYSGSSRLLQACSQAFDVSVFEIFFSWHVGICLCTAKKDDLFSDLEATINQLDITHLSLTPTVAALINPDNVPRVEFLVTAGEAVTEHVRRNWAGRGLFQGKISLLCVQTRCQTDLSRLWPI